jgi:hypothetical protein
VLRRTQGAAERFVHTVVTRSELRPPAIAPGRR